MVPFDRPKSQGYWLKDLKKTLLGDRVFRAQTHKIREYRAIKLK